MLLSKNSIKFRRELIQNPLIIKYNLIYFQSEEKSSALHKLFKITKRIAKFNSSKSDFEAHAHIKVLKQNLLRFSLNFMYFF